jgi:hypothetical protein
VTGTWCQDGSGDHLSLTTSSAKAYIRYANLSAAVAYIPLAWQSHRDSALSASKRCGDSGRGHTHRAPSQPCRSMVTLRDCPRLELGVAVFIISSFIYISLSESSDHEETTDKWHVCIEHSMGSESPAWRPTHGHSDTPASRSTASLFPFVRASAEKSTNKFSYFRRFILASNLSKDWLSLTHCLSSTTVLIIHTTTCSPWAQCECPEILEGVLACPFLCSPEERSVYAMMKLKFSSSKSKDQEVNCSLLISRDQGPPHKLCVMMNCHEASPYDCYLGQQPTYMRWPRMHAQCQLANELLYCCLSLHLDAIAKEAC